MPQWYRLVAGTVRAMQVHTVLGQRQPPPIGLLDHWPNSATAPPLITPDSARKIASPDVENLHLPLRSGGAVDRHRTPRREGVGQRSTGEELIKLQAIEGKQPLGFGLHDLQLHGLWAGKPDPRGFKPSELDREPGISGLTEAAVLEPSLGSLRRIGLQCGAHGHATLGAHQCDRPHMSQVPDVVSVSSETR